MPHQPNCLIGEFILGSIEICIVQKPSVCCGTVHKGIRLLLRVLQCSFPFSVLSVFQSTCTFRWYSAMSAVDIQLNLSSESAHLHYTYNYLNL